MQISSSTIDTLTTVAVGASATVAGAFLLWTIKKAFSPKIRCKLSCRCGKVQGQVCAKYEDSARIWCFCDDCRQYADFVAKQGNTDVIYGEYGESRIVQVCKSDVTIDKGQELLQLSRREPPPSKNGQVLMHRYYAKCCHTPIFQTVDFLGFVGIFTNNLIQGDYEKYAKPVAMYPELALKKLDVPVADIFVPDFLFKLLRYHWWRKAGPFDYDQTPTYWGKEEDSETKKDS